VLGSEQELKENFVKTGQVRMLFNPVLNHGNRSLQTHQAAECAAEQGQFWAYREHLFANQGRLWSGDVREAVKALAVEMALDTASFNACLDEQRHLALIQGQDSRRIQRGIRFQPSFEINEEFLLGSQPYDTFKQVIESHLGF